MYLPYLTFVFGAYCCCCDCCSRVSGIDQNDSFGAHYECDSQGFKGIDASFFDVLKEVLHGFDGALNNFSLVGTFIILFGKLSPKRYSDSEDTFSLREWYCPNNRLYYLY